MNNKTNYINVLLLICVLLFVIISVAIIAYSYLKQKNDNNNDSQLISENISDLKLSLMIDEDFIKLAKMSTPKHDNFTSMITNMLQIIDYSNFAVSDLSYKISRNDFNQAFYELYGIKLDDVSLSSLSKLKNLSELNGEVLINLESYSEIDNLVLIGIKSIEAKGKNLLAQIAIYEFYTNDSETESFISAEVSKAVLKNELLSEQLIEEYGINVQEKEIQFKENDINKYFKYQIVTSNILTTDTDFISQNLLIKLYIGIVVVLLMFTPVIYIKVKNANI